MSDPVGLNLADLREGNLKRRAHWRVAGPGPDWVASMHVTARDTAELLEALRRDYEGAPMQDDPDPIALHRELAGCLPDLVILIDLFATEYQIDLSGRVIEAFNACSDAEGLKVHVAARSVSGPETPIR